MSRAPSIVFAISLVVFPTLLIIFGVLGMAGNSLVTGSMLAFLTISLCFFGLLERSKFRFSIMDGFFGDKHQESRFTKFYQEVYLPTRYGFDKRRLHYSALIVSGQISRDEALQELAASVTTTEQAARDKKYVAKKLGITLFELERLIELPPARHEDYPSNEALYKFNAKLRDFSRVIKNVMATPSADRI